MIKEGKEVSAENAVAHLRKIYPDIPKLAVILGSGVNVLEGLHSPIVVKYEDLFGFAPSVAGHSGTLTIGRLGSSAEQPLVAVLRGRFHLYEGYPWSVVTLAARTMVEWGVPSLLATNAAGGLNLKYSVGDLMVLTGYRDHLSPRWKGEGLIAALKESTVDCRNELTARLLTIGEGLSKNDSAFRPLRAGVYAGLLGPNYETMAEIEMLRRLQCDAVGMSTVPELQVCAQSLKEPPVGASGTRAAAISVITNVWREDEPMGGHHEVLEASKAASRRLDTLMRKIALEH